MTAFPLMRTKWSNEHVMTGLFKVLILYLVPNWFENPMMILLFMAVVCSGLLVDVIANLIRYKRPICGVSAAVTAGIIHIVALDVPLYGQIAGVATALIVGKHLFGGTGKNIFNPAVIGILGLRFFYNMDLAIMAPSYFILPAVVLSLAFVKYRPVAALSFMTGMTLALIMSESMSMMMVIEYGVVFWGCLVLTDPVTVSLDPRIGLIFGLILGFVPLYLFDSIIALLIGILALNAISYVYERYSTKGIVNRGLSFKNNRIKALSDELMLSDGLIEEQYLALDALEEPSTSEVLERVSKSGVVGLGGGGFPTYKKIETVLDSQVNQKHLIINGVECDPGLIHDKWLMRRRSEGISKGIGILKRLIDFDSLTLAVKDKSDLEFSNDILIHQVKDYYPVGSEKILIRELLDRDLGRSIPAEQGILVLNVQTVYAIYEAVYYNKASDTKYLTVADVTAGTGYVTKVKLGEKIKEVVESIYPNSIQVFVGGGLMQSRIADEEDVIERNTNFIAIGDKPRYKESPLCSKCGMCEVHCPSKLKVRRITELIDQGSIEQAKELGGLECMSCGSCSYVCPAGRNLSSRLAFVKGFNIL